jgi:hypothetical protein
MTRAREQPAAAKSAKMPAPLRSQLNAQAVKILASLFDPDTSCDGTPWRLEKQAKGQVAVFSCEVPEEQAAGSSARRWKFVWDLPAPPRNRTH